VLTKSGISLTQVTQLVAQKLITVTFPAMSAWVKVLPDISEILNVGTDCCVSDEQPDKRPNTEMRLTAKRCLIVINLLN
jgi:hypothetical protein